MMHTEDCGIEDELVSPIFVLAKNDKVDNPKDSIESKEDRCDRNIRKHRREAT